MRLVIAGGGTGGHLYPGIAVARQAVKDGSEVLFIGTASGIEARVLPAEGFQLATIKAGKFKGMGFAGKLRTVAAIPAGIMQAARTIKGFGADVVLGVGGYASFSGCIAARLIGLPVVVQEQNAYPGLANRVIGRVADRVALGFREAAGFFPAGRCEYTGNPVRPGLGGADKNGALDAFGLKSGLMTVMAFGGSAGAHRINEAVTGAALIMPELKDAVQFLHQTGEKDVEMVKDAYREAGYTAAVLPYINDMAGAYACADMVVCRAGAMTVAEITSVGKPAVLVPYPHAANNHQEINARVLEKEGAAKVVLDRDADGARMASEIKALLSDKDMLSGMTGRSLSIGRTDSAEKVYGICRKVAGRQ